VLASLAPVYIGNYRLQQYLRQVAIESARPDANRPDASLKQNIAARAHDLGLPVGSDDVQITHTGAKLRLELSYKVQMHLMLYQVDLHFHDHA
jgi:hypothetical protein